MEANGYATHVLKGAERMIHATLTGHGVPAQLPGFGWADHTYVTSSDGRSWGCWGRSAGGTPLAGASAVGDADLADCISKTNSKAGIVYGTTGVCHQMANRILDPANVIVSAARGYPQSRMFYGTYGLPLVLPNAIPWPQKRDRCLAGSTANTAGGLGVEIEDGLKEPSKISDFYAQLKRGSQDWRSQSHQIITAETIDQFEGIQEECRSIRPLAIAITKHVDLFEERLPLIGLLLKGKLSGAAFARRVNDIAALKLEQIGRLIGEECFRLVYGCERGERIDVVQPDLVPDFTKIMRIKRARRIYRRSLKTYNIVAVEEPIIKHVEYVFSDDVLEGTGLLKD